MILQRTHFTISWMAKKLNVTRSGYYAWLHRQDNPGPRAREEDELGEAIEPIFKDHRERYGSFRIHQELRGQGFGVSRKRVARIMKKKGLYAKCRKRFKTHKPSGIRAVAGNLLNRQFCPVRPDLVWAGDITYIDTTDGWRYLAVWMDLHSRRIIGWALRETLDASLVTEALDRAFGCRSVNLDELMIHTDQGSQYTGKEFQKRLVDKKIKCSMSGKGNCWDNAVVESFFATLKDELEILDGLIRDPEQLLCDLWMWIEGYYNRKRRHSAIGYFTPIDFEERHLQRAKLMLMAA
jgi:putative transposase